MPILSKRPSRAAGRTLASLSTRCAFFLLILLAFVCTGAKNVAVAETADEDCVDKKGPKFRGKPICKWAGSKNKKKEEKRCLKRVKVKGRKKRVQVWKRCGCLCAKYIAKPDPDNETVEDKLCPAEKPSPFKEGSCIADGFKKNRECSYGYVWTGCTYDKLKCEPAFTCNCAMEPAAKNDEWVCTDEIHYPDCNTGDDTRRSEVPSVVGEQCVPGTAKPKPGEKKEETIGLRRLV